MHRWVKNVAVALWAVLVVLFPIGKYAFEKLADHLKWWDHPADTATTFLEAVLAVWSLWWVPWAIFALTGFLIGLWTDAFLRKIDRSTQHARRALGGEMLKGVSRIEKERKDRTDAECFEKFTASMTSLGVSARNAGLWYPVLPALEARHDGLDILLDYLRNVGHLLSDNHYQEAEVEAERLRRLNGLGSGFIVTYQRS